MAKGIHTEQTFEEAIESSLLESGGYVKGHSKDFDSHLGLFPEYIFSFLEESQTKEWNKIKGIHKTDVKQKVLQRLLKEIDLRGTLDVLRNGFTDYGVKFRMSYFSPETSLN